MWHIDNSVFTWAPQLERRLSLKLLPVCQIGSPNLLPCLATEGEKALQRLDVLGGGGGISRGPPSQGRRRGEREGLGVWGTRRMVAIGMYNE